MDKRILYIGMPLLIGAVLLLYARHLDEIIEKQGQQIKELRTLSTDPIKAPVKELLDTAKKKPRIDKAPSVYEAKIKTSDVLKRALAGGDDIEAWLKQFRLVSTVNIVQDEKNIEYLTEVENRLYNNGITYRVLRVYEVVRYELFVPIVTGEELKPFINRLCKNMGGCASSDEVEVEYNDVRGGVIVTWEGGC